jgi:hypothetical protein
MDALVPAALRKRVLVCTQKEKCRDNYKSTETALRNRHGAVGCGSGSSTAATSPPVGSDMDGSGDDSCARADRPTMQLITGLQLIVAWCELKTTALHCT